MMHEHVIILVYFDGKEDAIVFAKIHFEVEAFPFHRTYLYPKTTAQIFSSGVREKKVDDLGFANLGCCCDARRSCFGSGR